MQPNIKACKKLATYNTMDIKILSTGVCINIYYAARRGGFFFILGFPSVISVYIRHFRPALHHIYGRVSTNETSLSLTLIVNNKLVAVNHLDIFVVIVMHERNTGH